MDARGAKLLIFLFFMAPRAVFYMNEAGRLSIFYRATESALFGRAAAKLLISLFFLIPHAVFCSVVVA